MKELGIYIHIPFCKSKCYYCDFTSYTNRCEQIDGYIRNVIEEMGQYDFRKYNVTTDTDYYSIIRVKNTVLNINGQKEYKKELKNIIKKLNY